VNDTAWERLTDAIDIKCGITAHGKTHRPLEDRPDLEEYITHICFDFKDHQYKLERVGRPSITSRKSHYSHRAGTANRVENIYDPSELTYHVTLFQKVGEDWVEKDLSDLQLS
jgi:hypothetical protein